MPHLAVPDARSVYGTVAWMSKHPLTSLPCYPHMAGDIDFFVEVSEENAEKLETVL